MPAEPEIDTLFATPPAHFVAVRKELAAAARKKGQADLAIRIDSMKRPSPVVWVANAVAREHPREIAELRAAGEAIREAYASGEVDRVREATQRRQQAAAAALRAARSISSDAGRGANERRLARTFLGASMNAPQGELLARGRLEHEVEPPPLDGLLGEAPKLRPSKSRAAADRRPASDRAAQVKAHAKELRELEKETERAAAKAAQAAELSREKLAAAEAARKAAESARAAAEEASRHADERRRALDALRRSRGPA